MAPLCSLRLMPPACLEFAPFAMQAVLTGIGPSLIRNAKGHWHPDAKTWFSNQVLEQPGTAKVIFIIITFILNAFCYIFYLFDSV